MSESATSDASSPESSSADSRRRFLRRFFQIGGAGLAAPLVLSACGEGGEGGEGSAESFSCTDTSNLSQSEIQIRETQGYVDESPNPEEVCDNCSFWQPAAQGEQCGGCQVVPGPIHPQGYCNLWAEAAGNAAGGAAQSAG